MASISGNSVLFRAEPAPVPELSSEERERLYHQTDASIRRICEEEQKLSEEERSAREAQKEDKEARERKALDLIYEQGENINRYRDHDLQVVKGGKKNEGEDFLSKDYPLGATQIVKYGDTQRYFPRAWADEMPEKARIEVMAVISGSPFVPSVLYEMWNCRKETGCSAETMEKIRDEMKGWIGGLSEDDPVPTPKEVAQFIKKVLADLAREKLPGQMASDLRRLRKRWTGIDPKDRIPAGMMAEVQAELREVLSLVPLLDRQPAEQASATVPSVSSDAGKPAAAQGPPEPPQPAASSTPQPQADRQEDSPAVRFAPIFTAIRTQLSEMQRNDIEDTYFFLMRGDVPKGEIGVLQGMYPFLNREPTPVPAALYQEWVGALCQPDREARGRFALWCHQQPPHKGYQFKRHLQKLSRMELPPGLLQEMRKSLQMCT